jgi:hypothetical protein
MIKRYLLPALLLCMVSFLSAQTPESPERISPFAEYGNFVDLFGIPDFGVLSVADNAGGTGALPSNGEKAETGKAPLWLRDLRRAEIIAFGVTPFTIFFSTFFMDLYRSGTHGWDGRYMPWPFKSAGGISMTSGELVTMFTIAISGSVVFAVTDHVIMRVKRSAAAKRAALSQVE